MFYLCEIKCLIKLLEKETIRITFENFDINRTEMIELESLKALQKIKAIIENDSFEDSECFKQIEESVCAIAILRSYLLI